MKWIILILLVVFLSLILQRLVYINNLVAMLIDEIREIKEKVLKL